MEEYGNIISGDISGDNPDGFSWVVATLLTGLGAEVYICLFKKHNIGINTLVELTEEDLIKLGVDSASVRESITKGIRRLPQYEAVHKEQMDYSRKILNSTQAVKTICDASKLVQKLYLSTMACKISLKKDRNPSDSLIFPDQYASEVALKTLNKMESLIEAIESHLIKLRCNPRRNNTTRKFFIGVVGGATIALLTYGFARSLQNL